jgi:hypothetical protein
MKDFKAVSRRIRAFYKYSKALPVFDFVTYKKMYTDYMNNDLHIK